MSEIFAPQGLLKNPHVQGIVARLPHRKNKMWRDAAPMLQASRSVLLHASDAHLQGFIAQHGDRPRTLVCLLHGWEGSSQSLYILATAQALFQAGYDVLRLNLRDHGDSHHLNEALFHSCREREVREALHDAQQRFNPTAMALIGFSLGGNFALRIALRAPQLCQRVFAVCPVLCPDTTLRMLEQGWFIYHQYFMRRWRQSLQRKSALFPQRFTASQWQSQRSLRALTEHLVLQHTEYPSLAQYLQGYTLSADLLAPLAVPTQIILSADDPVIAAEQWRALHLPRSITLNVQAHGGHCGFVRDWRGNGWIEPFLCGELHKILAP